MAAFSQVAIKQSNQISEILIGATLRFIEPDLGINQSVDFGIYILKVLVGAGLRPGEPDLGIDQSVDFTIYILKVLVGAGLRPSEPDLGINEGVNFRVHILKSLKRDPNEASEQLFNLSYVLHGPRYDLVGPHLRFPQLLNLNSKLRLVLNDELCFLFEFFIRHSANLSIKF